MAKKLSPAPRGGSDTMRQRGLKPILVTVTPAQHQAIRVAAAEAGLPMSHFLRELALARIAKKNSNAHNAHQPGG